MSPQDIFILNQEIKWSHNVWHYTGENENDADLFFNLQLSTKYN